MSSEFNDFCELQKINLRQEPAWSISNIFSEEFLNKADKLLEYNCKSAKQHRFLPPKSSN